MKKIVLRLLGLLLVLTQVLPSASSQDQILDGIGETGMIARYILNGDTRDWSRNGLHGVLHGQQAAFVNDSRFGKVLSLSGASDTYVSLPAGVLSDFESLSLSGWLYLKSEVAGQTLFDFGQNASNHVLASPAGSGNAGGFQTRISVAGKAVKEMTAEPLPLNKWIYFSVVADVPAQSLRVYTDGKLIREEKGILPAFAEATGQPGSGEKFFFIGKSASDAKTGLNALLYDFRIYRVPLSTGQIAGIFNSRRRGINEGSVNVRKPEAGLPVFSAEHSKLYNAYLLKADDVRVETPEGILPRLPRYVKGAFKSGYNGPDMVRVLWPADIDNTAVRNGGSYTITGRVPGTDLTPKALITVKKNGSLPAPKARLEAFRLNQVSLDDDLSGHKTKFIENRNKFINTLAGTDPNSFLYMFRHAFGQQQPEGAKPLGVWDSKETKLRGHATGHYLTAIAQAYASAGYDKALQNNFAHKIEYMVNTLYDLSMLSGKPAQEGGAFVSDASAVPVGKGKADYDSDLSDQGIRNDYWNWGKGFISAYPPDQFIMLEKGAKYGTRTNQIWAPYYTLHKILAGLLDVYEVTGNKKALEIVVNMGEWVNSRLSKLPKDTLIEMWNTYIAGEYGGMNEAMARLYGLTGNIKYLQTAKLFDNIRLFYGDAQHTGGLAKNVDLFRGLHANQHIPQIVGSIVTYQVSGDPDYYHIADNFWYKVVNDYMYSIGGVAGARNPANAECFTAQPATLYENGFSEGGQNETCATYNMLKLTDNLFMFDQRPELMDYYERGLYNHILASVAEHTPANTYHVPLRPGSVKSFGNPQMTGFTCCNGTAIESSTKLQNSIYFKSKDNQALYVNLFVASTLHWTERNITVKQSTDFPKSDETRLVISGRGKFDLKVRVPGWATKGFFVKINGKDQKINVSPGSYLTLSRSWKNGDIVELKMPFQFHLDPVMDQQNIASLFYGPVLLAAQEPEARKDWRKVTLDARDPGKSIQGDPSKLLFTIDGIEYKPFYDTYGRHSVYLDVTLK